MLAQVLCHKNNPRIRIFGFRLLLLWINDQTTGQAQVVRLKNLTSTSLTLAASLALKQGQKYVWWIGAVSVNGQATAWSSGLTFTVT